MSFVRRHGIALLGVVVLVLLASNVVRYLLSPSPEQVRADDRRAADRVVEGADDRDPLPSGEYVGGNGVVEPRDRETKLAAPVAGRIARIAAMEGRRVAVGDVLIELEGTVQTAALAAAEAELAAARADASRLARGNRVEDVEAADADLAAAQARAELSASVAARSREVAAAGGLSADELDRAERQAQADHATVQGLAARQRATRRGFRFEEVAAARARVAAAVARRDEAKARLERLSVRSPIVGEVLQVKYRVGEYVVPGQSDPVVVLGDTRELRVRMDVDERDVGKVRVGATALVRAVAFRGRDFEARVVEIGRRMGRKNVRSDDPVERNDTKILEVVLVLEQSEGLLVGQRVMGFVRTDSP